MGEEERKLGEREERIKERDRETEDLNPSLNGFLFSLSGLGLVGLGLEEKKD